jgi:hypothetical protein
LDKPVLQNPETLQKNLRFEIFLGPLKIAGNCRKNQNFKTCTLWENHEKNPNFETCSKNFPTGKPSHLPLVSPHICLQIKDSTYNSLECEVEKKE